MRVGRALGVAAFAAIFLAGCGGALTGPDDLIVANPEEAVRTARVMIEEKRADHSKYNHEVIC